MNPEFVEERGQRDQQLQQQRILADRRRLDSLTAPRNGQIRKVNFNDFKNHYGQNHAPIEVLVAGPDLMSEVREQIDLRGPYGHIGRHGFEKTLSNDEVDVSLRNEISSTQFDDENAKQEAEGEIQRVRIHSLHVLAVLTDELGSLSSWYWPRTFFRPFKALVYLQPGLKARLADLEAKWSLVDHNAVQSVGSGDFDLNKHNIPSEKTPKSATNDKSPASSLKSFTLPNYSHLKRGDYLDSVEAIEALRVYLQFVDKEIMPLYNQFEVGKVQTITFADLWSLFKPGELVYSPSTGKSDDCYHEVWRLYRVKASSPVCVERQGRKDGGWPRPMRERDDRQGMQPSVPTHDDRRGPPPPPPAVLGPVSLSEQWFTLYCYYIDHDSHAFGAVRQTFTIDYFPGERAIDSLAIFPLRFHPDCTSKKAALNAQGQKFARLLEGSHRYQSYSAWTLIRNPPCDEARHWEIKVPDGPDGEPLRHPEFIESNVIVDLAEAFQTVPSWKPEFHEPTPSKAPPIATREDILSIRRWDSHSKERMLFDTPDIIQMQDGIEIRQRNLNLEEDSFLKSRDGGYHPQGPDLKRDYELTDEDFMLLPKRLFAYSLRDRKFVIIDLDFLEDTKHDRNVFRNLQIPEAHKTVVSGLVSSHFERKELERRLLTHRSESISQDLVQGKGKGLVMLLHGAPGVGKTATAEAVAMEYRKPLFVMTCGDLGLTPDEIEKSLTKIFRLAHVWECVLLLDEADVFLTQRTVLDMKRNAMVSVFLRVLEYYNGLLFLTTNRVGTIDEAFKSRIHMSLYYQPLSEEQTVNIFRYNLAKLSEIERQRSQVLKKPMLDIRHADILEFAQRHYRESVASGRWNGRQIRNAFQIASSLAHHHFALQSEDARDKGSEEPSHPVLHQEFFRKVQTATQEFSEYMAETLGVTDARRAFQQGERNDDFVSNTIQQQSLTTRFVPADRNVAPEYGPDGPRYGQTSVNPQPAFTWSTSQYSGLAQSLGQSQYQPQSNHPVSSYPPQAQFNHMQPPQTYIPTQMGGGQPMGSQPVQIYAQPPAQSQLYAQQPMQQAQPQPFGQSQASPSQPVPMYMATQSQPQGSLYHQAGQIQLQNQNEQQHTPSETPQTAMNGQPSMPNVT